MDTYKILVIGICIVSSLCCVKSMDDMLQRRIRNGLGVKTMYESDKHVSQNFPFRDPTLSFEKRVNDLVGRLTLDDIVLQMAMGGGNADGPAPAIPSLGIKPYQWDTECLRGYAYNGRATGFPQPIGLAATFHPDMIENMARVIGLEARANFNNFSSHGMYQTHTGLTCFAPVINIMRHPLWGRNQETYGEDPYLTGMFAKHYVKGLQGYHDKFVTAAAVCKHLDVHGGPENIPGSPYQTRFGFNAVISERDWQMTHLPAFRACLGAKPLGVMCSYNAINGVPSCANKKLLTDILRGELGFKGFVTSDEGAVDHIDYYFNYTSGPLETAVVAVKAGVSLEISYFGKGDRFLLLKEAVQKNMISEDLLRERVKLLFLTRMRLGEFDTAVNNPYAHINMDVVQSPEHQDLAKTIASKSLVLLKNFALPLKKKYEKAAIVGPFAKNKEAVTGDYPTIYNKLFISPYDGVQKLASQPVTTLQGCAGEKWDVNLPKCKELVQDEIKLNIPGQKLIVVTLGTGIGLEAEALDKVDLSLPGKQLDLLKSVVEYADNDAIIILLLFNAGPLDVSWAVHSSSVHAIIACHFTAQTVGEAIYRVLSGLENPAARLPSTWPASLDHIPDITNYTMHERTYRYSTVFPLFPFGYGLSYTTFEYEGVSIGGSNFKICDPIGVSVSVKNTGDRYGEEVIQVYLSWQDATVTTPIRQLVSFKRIGLHPQESKVVYFTIKPEQRAVWTDDLVLEPGRFLLHAGGQQPDQTVRASSNIVSEHFVVSGSTIPLKSC